MHKILEQFGYVPKLPVPFGSKSLYDRPWKEYKLTHFKLKSPTFNNKEMWVRQMIQEQITLLERRRRLMFEAESNLGENGSAVPKLEEARTSDIESDEADIFERRRKFGELSKRLDAHRKETLKLRGNDLRYNMYIKKIQKLTRKDLGLDLEAYKDFVNNLKQFAHVNADFEIFAKDNLKLNDPEYRELIRLNGEIVTSPSDITEAERVKLRTADIYNTLRKLKREYDSHLVDKDRKNIEEFTKDVRKYLQADWDLFEFVKAFYIRRKKEVADRDKQTKIEFDKITPGDLKKAGLS